MELAELTFAAIMGNFLLKALTNFIEQKTTQIIYLSLQFKF